MDERMMKHGIIGWNELLTTNVGAATSFYTKLFGWTAEEMSADGEMHYTIFKAGENQVGGMMTLPQEAADMGAPPHWGAYVTVDDVDAIAKEAVELGAKMLVPLMDVASVGRFCTFQDPQGAVISVITYATPEE